MIGPLAPIGAMAGEENKDLASSGQYIPGAESPSGSVSRLGCMAGQITTPADFDSMGQDEIERLFAPKPALPPARFLLISGG